jgi:SAM-dependent methyltransferase
MHEGFELNRLLWDERAEVHARDAGGFYRLARLRGGGDVLCAIDDAEIGDIRNKRVLHMQCHIGTDTLSLVRRGAVVTGLDFSPVAIEVARRLAAETGLDAQFVLGPVELASDLTPGPFDLVYTTWGTTCWFPDIKAWGRAIAAVLRPGGELYFADVHPGFTPLEEIDGKPIPTYAFDTPLDQPLTFNYATTYTNDPTPMTNRETREWIHSLSSLLDALMAAGLTLTRFREHEVLPWQALPSLVPAGGGLWRAPENWPRMALSFSLRAKKAEA